MKSIAAVIRTMPIVLMLGLPSSAQAVPLQSIGDLVKVLESTEFISGTASPLSPFRAHPP